MSHNVENGLPQPVGRPQGGAKSDAGRAAYWRMQWESAIGALADLIAEHTETVEELERLRAECPNPPGACPSCGSVAGYADGPPCLTCHYDMPPGRPASQMVEELRKASEQSRQRPAASKRRIVPPGKGE